MAKRFKKTPKGQAAKFITRTQALRKLQLKLRDFRLIWMLQGGGAVMMLITGLLMAGLYRKARSAQEEA